MTVEFQFCIGPLNTVCGHSLQNRVTPSPQSPPCAEHSQHGVTLKVLVILSDQQTHFIKDKAAPSMYELTYAAIIFGPILWTRVVTCSMFPFLLREVHD